MKKKVKAPKVPVLTEAERLAKRAEFELEMQEHLGLGPKCKEAATNVLKALNGHRADKVLALVYEKCNCSTLDIEWTLDSFWANVARKTIPQLNKIYSTLVKNKYSKKNKHSFNDLDDNIWYIPNKESRIFVHTSQNLNLLFVWDKGKSEEYTRLHIRRFWDEFKPTDKWGLQDEQDFKDLAQQKGRTAILLQNNYFTDQYSDQVEGKVYFNRPTFNYWSSNGFKFDYDEDHEKSRFQDGRDLGYVMSYSASQNKVDSALSHHSLLKIVFECYIPSISCELDCEE